MNGLLASDRDGDRPDLLQTIFVNGREISPQQVYREMQYHPAATPAEAIFNAARSLVLGELLSQRARAQGLCDREILPGSADFDTAVDKLLQLEVPVPKPGRPSCLEYYCQHREQFASPPLAEVRHILLQAPGDDGEEAHRIRQLARSLLRQVEQSADPLKCFAQLAGSHSRCSSKDSGGSLGQVGPGDTVPEFEEAVFGHGVGLVPEPVASAYGLHLIYVEQFEPGRPLGFETVREKIAQQLQESLRRRMIRVYLLDLVSHAHITGIDLLSKRDWAH
ncbi:peptidylprolyl isomerase [Microbulbifer rhizosphaerae]|uniref:peptidylprolyl isomerase n=1 Tax=Microbulbifer rhizosphaerae TaxID=1562603 RepID=A0A7W4WDS3_9GAMM|nr:peptidylprolyl isomerase [Microbulbifer rhizosphaerae]MBB3062373.1 peptidyl-prolyl cis-trans isomerase C [Microbulbifer rhizosphaerae]